MERNNRCLSWKDILDRVKNLPKGKCYGVPRGGQVVAGLTGQAVDTPEEADYIVDDLVDSGKTKNKWIKKYPNKPFYVLYDKTIEKDLGWLEFPWEESGERDTEDNIIRLLQNYNIEVTEKRIEFIKNVIHLL